MSIKLSEQIIKDKKIGSKTKKIILSILKENSILKKNENKIKDYLSCIKKIINKFFYNINNIQNFGFNWKIFDLLIENIKDWDKSLKNKKFIMCKSVYYRDEKNISNNKQLNISNKNSLIDNKDLNSILSLSDKSDLEFENLNENNKILISDDEIDYNTGCNLKINTNIMEDLVEEQKKSNRTININNIENVKKKLKNDEILIGIMDSIHDFKSNRYIKKIYN